MSDDHVDDVEHMEEQARRLQAKVSARETLGGMYILTFTEDGSFWRGGYVPDTGVVLLEAALHLRILSEELEAQYLQDLELSTGSQGVLREVRKTDEDDDAP